MTTFGGGALTIGNSVGQPHAPPPLGGRGWYYHSPFDWRPFSSCMIPASADAQDSSAHAQPFQDALSLEELQALDTEGRCVATDHGRFVLFNVYCPAGRCTDKYNDIVDEDRYAFRLRFLATLQSCLEGFLKRGRHVVLVCGSVVSAHPPTFPAGPVPTHSFPPGTLWRPTLSKGLGLGLSEFPPVFLRFLRPPLAI